MRQKSNSTPASSETLVRNIRRATRKHHAAERASGVYKITQLLPPEGEAFQYRIKNVNEPHERVAKESELRSA